MNKMEYKVLLYYKFNNIESPEEFTDQHRNFCEKHNLKGRILIGKEGINGTCAGLPEDIQAYKDFVHSLKGFEDMWFKEQTINHVPFPKLVIKHRKEIITIGDENLDMSKIGKHISPTEFNEMVEQGKKDDSVVVLDARNRVESDVGKFKDAITPDIRFFREFPKAMEQHEDIKDKKVLMYCTGGIRCEKASAHLIQQGFKDVYQLNGGIYNYCNQYPDGLFEGSCFVFDDRMQVDFKGKGKVQDAIPEEKIISSCKFCNKKTSRVVNDERQTCRHLIVCCEECDKSLDVSRVRYGEEKREAVTYS